METYGGAEVKFHSFLISALGEGEWSAHISDNLHPGNAVLTCLKKITN
jgi:hypothetical protein